MTLTITPTAQDAIETGRTGPDWEPTSKTAFYAQRGEDFAFGPTPEAATEALLAKIAPTPAVDFDLDRWLDGFWPNRHRQPASALTNRVWVLRHNNPEERGEDAVDVFIFRSKFEAIRAFALHQIELLDGFSDDPAEMLYMAAHAMERIGELRDDLETMHGGYLHITLEEVRI